MIPSVVSRVFAIRKLANFCEFFYENSNMPENDLIVFAKFYEIWDNLEYQKFLFRKLFDVSQNFATALMVFSSIVEFSQKNSQKFAINELRILERLR